MSIIAFIASVEQLRSLKLSGNELGSIVVATGDLDVMFALESDKLSFINLRDFLTADQFDENCLSGRMIAAELATLMKGRIVCQGQDLMEVMHRDLLFPFYTAFNIADAVMATLARFKPEEVVHFGEMEGLSLHHDSFYTSDLFNAMVASCAKRAGVPTRSLQLKIDVSACNRSPVGHRTSACRLPFLDDTCRMISVWESLGLQEQILYLRGVAATGARDLVLVSEHDAGLPLPFLALSLLRKLPWSNRSARVGGQQLMDALRQLRSHKDLRIHPAVYDDDNINSIWCKLENWLMTGVVETTLARLLHSALTPNVALVGWDIAGSKRCFTGALIDHGCPTLSIDHVGLSVNTIAQMNEGARSDVAVWGEYDEREQRKFRSSHARAFQVGSLRLDLDAIRTHGLLKNREKTSNEYGTRQKIILFTVQDAPGGNLSTFPTLKLFLKSWRQLGELIYRRPEWRIIVKTHPRFDRPLMYAHLLCMPPHLFEVSSVSAAEALDGASVAIIVNNPSTVVVDAIVCGVPTIYLRDAVPQRIVSPIEEGGAITVQSVADMESEIKRLLTDSEYRTKILEQQQDFLKRALVATGDEAIRRLKAALNEIASDQNNCAPDPAARWILNMIMSLDYGLRGAVSRSEFRLRLRELKVKGAGLQFGHLDYLDTHRLGEYFLSLVVWERWPVDGPLSIPDALWRIYASLPRTIKPERRVFRAYLVQAFLVEASRGTGITSKRMVCKSLACVLSPGRIFRSDESSVKPEIAEKSPFKMVCK